MTQPTTLAEWLAHCERLHPKQIDMTLSRTKTLIERLGLKFAMPVISVAGTNGKGSTCAMLEAMALAAGYKVGAYIKPHLVHFEERCRVNGVMVKAEDLLPHFEAVEAARGEIALTYFEFTTLVIMRTLASAAVDLVITDVNMPNMDGITLVRELRLLPHYRGVPLLVLTTEASAEKKLEGKAAGATGWVVKPFSPDRLLATIARIVA